MRSRCSRPVARHRAALLLALGLAFPTLAAAHPHPGDAPPDTLRLTLPDAEARARTSGPAARLARAEVAAAAGRWREAFAAALPGLSASAGYDRSFASVFGAAAGDPALAPLATVLEHSPFAARHTWTAGLALSQVLWSGGRTGAGIAAARAGQRSAAAQEREAEGEAVRDARIAWLDALLARDAVAIAEASREQALAHLAQVRAGRAQGVRTEYDEVEAEVDAADTGPPLLAARSAAALALLELGRRLGLPAEQPLVLADSLAFDPGAVPVPVGALADAGGRPALARAEADVAGLTDRVRGERAESRPRLVARATLTQQAFPDDPIPARDAFVRSADAGVALEWPLFDGGRRAGRVAQAEAALAAGRARRDDVRAGVAIEAGRAGEDVRRTLAVLLARRGTADLVARAESLTRVRWANGLATPVEVADARLRLASALLEERRAVRDYRAALAQSEFATGRPPALALRSWSELAGGRDGGER